MHHLRSISRHRPAAAQVGGPSLLGKLSFAQALVEFLVFLRDVVEIDILNKEPAAGD